VGKTKDNGLRLFRETEVDILQQKWPLDEIAQPFFQVCHYSLLSATGSLINIGLLGKILFIKM